MIDASLERKLRELVDRQEIHDVILRYCRGVDRMDRALLLSAYHPDAIDDHGLFVGGPEAFADYFMAFHGSMQSATQHIITNHFCELDGDTAHTETYWMFSGRNKLGPPLTLSGGRYVDRFEKRNGKWAIAARKCVIEWNGVLDEAQMPQENLDAYALTGVPLRDRNDVSYARPLQITRGKFVLPF